MEQTIKLIIVDDHEMVLQGLNALLGNQPGIEVLDVFLNGNDAAEAIDRLNPDIVLTDINMPIINGFETAQLIRKKKPEMKIIMLSMENKEGYVKKAKEENISAYVTKDAPINELIAVIKKVYLGETHFNV
ncbi:MAG: response regulator transcription factor [Bacteroidota bacterium]